MSIQFQATYYDGIHPVGQSVTVIVSANGKTSIVGENISYSCHWKDVNVANQLGTTPRNITFPNTAKCETTAHQEINLLQDQFSQSGISKYLHVLESNWQYVFLASFIVVGFTWGMVVYGIPALAKTVAYSLPVSVDEKLTEGTLAILDKNLLNDSELDDVVKDRIDKKFKEIAERSQDDHQFRLLFRKGLGANAFALPSGHIIVTDELVTLSESDDEVLAVLAHEIGHVVHEHGLRSVLQSSAVALLLTAVTGDISSASGFAAAMPIIFLETNYSRKFELEADQYALNYMQAHNIDTVHFATILKKITGDTEQQEKSAFSYLSTHPDTLERIKPFEAGRQGNQ